ncbi:MAG: trypsin-like peptidase domain-containing protein [Gemmataceae bacterium]
MTGFVRWAAITTCLVCLTAIGTWIGAKQWYQNTAPPGETEQNKEVQEAPVKLLVAFAQPLAKSVARPRPDGLTRILENADLRTPAGRKIDIQTVTTTSQKMIEGVLNGSLEAQILIPASPIYLDLADQESTLKSGKPALVNRTAFMQMPYVFTMRRTHAEAMGWPGKQITWLDLKNLAKDGWKSAGRPEWGNLKTLMVNPEYSDAGLQCVMSFAHAVLNKSKDLNSDDFSNPKFSEALQLLGSSIVWYASSFDDLIKNETLDGPGHCDVVYLPEHHLISLNEHTARRKLQPAWVAIYPRHTIVDQVTAAVVDRQWSSEEQRSAGEVVLKYLQSNNVQKRLLSVGYRPMSPDLPLAAPLDSTRGIDPTQPRAVLELPPAPVVLDALSAWNKSLFTKGKTVPSGNSNYRQAEVTHSHMTPTVRCVHRAKPCTVLVRRTTQRTIIGTGVIVDPRGYLVTNRHVVGTDSAVTVRFLGDSDKEFPGKVVWNDPRQDLAIVKIEAAGSYPVIGFADSDQLEEGETVVAIGNPLGYIGSVSLGIISALNREVSYADAVLTQLIQTDASINPGNSGGPLLNIEGNLIGINVAVRTEAQNIAFSIPSNRVHKIVKEQLAKFKT